MKITASTEKEFKGQLEEYLRQEHCKTKSNIVYYWKVESPIPRVNGESNIIYIGQSSNSLSDRYLKSRAFNHEVRGCCHFVING